jgi:PDDEXK-like domain of unknown function (DUF3799)
MQSILWDGKKIQEPGIRRGLSLTAYHTQTVCDAPSISHSIAGPLLFESPAHAKANSPLNPHHSIDATNNDSLLLGAAYHSILAGEPLHSNLAFCPNDFDARRKKDREWAAEQAAAGLIVVTPKRAEQLKGMIQTLGDHPLVRAGLLNGAPERAMFWRDRERAFWKKARPDQIPNDSGDYVNLKTTSRQVTYHNLQRVIVDFHYDMQAAMVAEGARELGLPFTSFSFVFVETQSPYCVRVMTLKDEDLERAHRLNQLAYDIFWACLQSNCWPGPGDDRPDAEYIDLPDWYRKSVEDRVKFQLREVAQ